MSIDLANTSDSPAKTQHHDSDPTPSILEDVISGLIEPRADAPGEYKPKLIANRPGGSNMRNEIGRSLATSDSFDISVAFVSAEAVLSLFEDFRSHHETAKQAGRLITSTKITSTTPEHSGNCYTFKTPRELTFESGRVPAIPQLLLYRKGSHSIRRDTSSPAT